jgi:hypothetical protein
VFGTVAASFVFNLLVAVPLTNARIDIMTNARMQFPTEVAVEQELARRYPLLYKVRMSSGFYLLAFLMVLYVVSFIVNLVILPALLQPLMLY